MSSWSVVAWLRILWPGVDSSRHATAPSAGYNSPLPSPSPAVPPTPVDPARLPAPLPITARDQLAAGPRRQPRQDPQVQALLQEVHRAVGECEVRPPGVEAVRL